MNEKMLSTNLSFDYTRLRELPNFVLNIGRNFEGWLVGGGAFWFVLGEGFPKDFDIIVPLHRWMEVARTIPYKTESNTFGGFKVRDRDTQGNLIGVDIWAEDLGHFLMSKTKQSQFCVQIQQQIIVTTIQ
jgi:hypothetical protein